MRLADVADRIGVVAMGEWLAGLGTVVVISRAAPYR
jgi:hypothetical protein